MKAVLYFDQNEKQNVSSSDFEERKIVSRTVFKAKISILDTNFTSYISKIHSN